jgi:hypothetical protein
MRPNRAPVTSLILTLVSFAMLLACGGPPLQSDGSASSADQPDLSDDVIRERLNQARVRDIPEENGAGEPISWRFFEEEPKEVVVVDRQVDGNRATIVLDIKTQSTPRAREPRALAGQIRTDWELTSGWALRQWEIVKTENISMKYKDLPKPAPTNSNENR